MKKTRKKPKPLAANEIARLAERGEDVSRFFTNSGRMIEPNRRVKLGTQKRGTAKK
jgi:hypothetical protein